MLPHEPNATALLLTTFGGLLLVSALFSRASARTGVPVVLVFLGIGMVAGIPRMGGVQFDDFQFALRVGIIALVLILFDGGLNTSRSVLRQSIRPAAMLATLGVIGTALLMAVAAHSLGIDWAPSLLLGAVVSSTDAAAVFSVLRGSGINLKRRVGSTLETESGLNDPVAILLTILLTENLLHPLGASELRWVALDVALEIVVGLAVGVGVGRLGSRQLERLRLPAGGLYPAFTLSLAFLSFGVATLLHGSGFLAVYVAAVIVGNRRLPYRTSLLRVHDASAWLSQIVMFLILGLLVTPTRLLDVATIALGLSLFLALIARPAVVAVCLVPFGYTLRDILYIGWVGLRGAVPIVLATFPVLARAPGADWVFHVTFFIVVVNAIVPGMTVPWVTRWLGLESADPPTAPAILEIESMRPLNGELLSFYIDEALPVTGTRISELPFPAGSAVTLVVRGQDLVAPKGHTVLQPGDHVYVLTEPGDREWIHLMFGRTTGG
jgi:cell volume regulation protein A